MYTKPHLTSLSTSYTGVVSGRGRHQGAGTHSDPAGHREGRWSARQELLRLDRWDEHRGHSGPSHCSRYAQCCVNLIPVMDLRIWKDLYNYVSYKSSRFRNITECSLGLVCLVCAFVSSFAELNIYYLEDMGKLFFHNECQYWENIAFALFARVGALLGL